MYLMCASRRFSPAQVPNLAGWYDASDKASLFTDTGLTTQVVSDADPIGGWKDLSGTGRHLTQGTAGQQFLYKVNIQNGKSAAVGDAGDSFMTMTSAAVLSEVTVFLACKPNEDGTEISVLGGTAAFRFFHLQISSFVQKVRSANGNTAVLLESTNAFVNDGNNLFVAQFSDSANLASMRMNGAANGSADVSAIDHTINQTTNIVGAGDGAGAQSYFRNLYELIIYHRSLSISEIVQVENYLRAKWGLYS